MKCKRLLAGMMSLAMLCSVASTPIYALDEAGANSVPALSQETDSAPAANPDPTPAPEETPAPTEAPAPEETPAPTEAPAPEETPAPTEAPAPEATPAPTETPAPEATPAPTETPAPEATPAPTATPAPAANTLQNNLAVTADAKLAAEAERYYGENGIITVGGVSAVWNSQSESETVLAGETLTLDIDWFLEAASSYTYASHQESMFEEYRNTVITLQLPEHVTILDPDVTAGKLNNVESIEDLGNNTWAIHLSSSIGAVSASNGTLSLPLFVEGNGLLPIGTPLNFSQEKISLTTQFTILDRTSGQPVETNLHYEKTYEKSLPADKVLGSNDQWSIQKQVNGNPVIDETAETVTLQFTLTVGLVEKDVITDNPQTYSREGRVPFQDNLAELTEIPTVKGYDGRDIQPQSVTVTPTFGDNPQPIQVSGNQRITLPVDTVGNHTDIVTGQVDGGAPYWSQYQVTLVYDYQDFVADYNENSDPLDVLNTATLYYTLDTVGGGTEQTARDDATQPVRVVAQPATLTVNKYILEGDAATPYDTTYTASAIQGAAGFTIRRTDGESFTLYTYSDGRYQAQTGTTVTVDPKGSGALNGTNGSVTVYLDPGSYEITESQYPANTQPVSGGEHNADPKTVTIQAGASATAAFYNRALLGSVTVTKTDEKGQRMAGATFRLYNDDESYNQTLTTGTDGVITFRNLPYGSYHLEETEAPDGYLASTVLNVDVTEEHPHLTYTVPNYPSQITVTLQKQKVTSEGAKNLESGDVSDFRQAFTLEKKDSTTGEWEVVQANLSLGTQGRIVREVEVYENGDPTKPITYRFMETLPTGWHDPDDAEATIQYSDEFTMLDENDAPANKTIYMENRANGTLRLTKEFYTVQNGRYTRMTGSLPNATFALYRKLGDTVTRVGESYTTQNGRLTIRDLAPADENGTLYEYYLVETPVQGYQGDTTNTTDLVTPDQGTLKAYGPYTFAGDTRLVTPTVKNYQTGVIVYKVNSVTGAFVKGTKVTVYAYDETQPDHKGAALEGKTDLAVANGGTFIPLDAGSKYVVEETVWNTQQYQPDEKSGEVDLTAVTVGQDDQIPTVTLKNTPMPCLRITKTSQDATGASTTLSSRVNFEVYTGSETDHLYTPVKNSDGSTLTIRNNQDVYLPAGTYYLKEVSQTGLVDPSAHPEVYTGENWIKETGATYYKVELSAVTADTAGQKVTVSIPNYADRGAVTMTKYAAQTTGGTAPLQGARISLYRVEEDENGQPKEALVNTKTTDSNGKVNFGNLAIYDANGQKIIYRLRETAPPNNYSLNPETLEFTLTPGQTVTTYGNNQPLQLVDQPLVTFQVTKVYRKLWEYNFTRKDYVLQGARIALFRQEADGSYSYDKMATTDELGQVSFANLEQDVTYVAVEYDVPGNVEDFAYLTPWDPRATDDPNQPGDQRDRIYLSATYTLEQLQAEDFRLSADDLTKYNYVTKPARTGDAAPVSRVEDTLYNAEHWTQLHIEKFVTETQGENIGQERPINNAQFALYRQVVGDGATELSFDQSRTTFVGRYSSGTLYDTDSNRMDGWFGTDILQAGANIVYWLVEETPGIGAAIRDQNRVILIARRGTSYTNNTDYTYTYQDENGQAQQATAHCTQKMEYVTDQVTEKRVENDPLYGDGGAMYATLRIAKWAGSYDQDGNKLYNRYDPLGNATFDVYVVHADGSPVEKIDTLTTGLDNDNEDLANPNNLTAWASSRSYDFQALWDKYAGENTKEKDVIWRDGGTDDTGNGYLRLMLVETSTPTGYHATTQLFKMVLFFEDDADDTVTETFNDAYYIKNNTPANDQEKTTDDQGDAWACYPVDGQGNALTVEDPTITAGQYRLVNWPVDNFAVTVTKYGYPYSNAVQGMTNSELTAYFQSDMSLFAQLTPLKGVTLRLERFTNNSWQTYAYPLTNGKTKTDGLLETDAKGYFAFPGGLIVGRYRLIEVNGPTGYDLIYDGSEDQKGNEKVFYFEVSNENVNLMLYNPESVEISVQKQDLSGGVLRGATFTLSQNGQTVSQGSTTLTTNRSGVYTLAETTAPSGYSNTYFANYLQETYQGYTWNGYNLGNFASDGIYLGYQTEAVVDEETDEPLDVKVTQKVDLSSYKNSQSAALDPLTLAIWDPQQASLTLTKKDGNTQEPVSGVTFQVWYQPFTNWSDTPQAVGTNWTELLTDNAAARTTGATGTVTLNGLNPGIYKVQESSGPATYTLDKTPQYIVLTGGMNKTVTQNETNLPSGSTSGSLAFTNYKKVDLTVNKTVATGLLTMPADESHTFTFTLTKADGSKVEKKMEWPEETSVTFEDLDQNAQYTLTETCDNRFVFQGFAGVEMDGNNTFTMPRDDDGLTVTATNTWLQASLTVQKVDGATGEPLDGATLEVYRIDTDEDGQKTATEVGTMTGNGQGDYTLSVALNKTTGETFEIRETQAPAGYVLKNQTLRIENVKPGDAVRYDAYDKTMANNDEALQNAKLVPNYTGAIIELTKYGNRQSSLTDIPLEGATFLLYRRVDGENGEAATWQQAGRATTNAQGKISFTVDGNAVYALKEEGQPDGYAGLEGIWAEDTEITPDEEGYYLLNGGQALQSTVTYAVEAYDIPYTEVELRKENALDKTKTAPTATAAIYEVDTSTMTADQVKALLADQEKQPLATVNIRSYRTGKQNEYSYATVKNRFAVGKTYLVVETQSNISQIQDHNAVVWYQVYTVPDNDEAKIVTLRNVEGKASQSLTKTTTQESYPSLMASAAELEYTLTPQVGNNTYPLDSYTLADNGLVTAKGKDPDTHVETTLAWEDYLKDAYTITGVTLEASSHDAAAYLDGTEPNDLKATVRYYDFGGNEITALTQTLDASVRQVLTPVTTTPIAKVTVSYESLTLKQQTGYALGQYFVPGTVTVKIRLNRQQGGPSVWPISQVENQAEATLVYTPRNGDGTPGTQVTDTKRDTAANTFGELEAARVSVDKEADQDHVQLGDTVTYTITIHNAETAGAPYYQPFLVDLLPQGTALAGNGGNARLQSAPEGVTLRSLSTSAQDGENALFIYLDGNLDPGESATLQLDVKIEATAALHGSSINNYVLAGSQVKGIQSASNPQSSSFQSDNGQWPKSLDGVVTTMEEARRNTLRAMLEEKANFGFVSDKCSITWATNSHASVIKTGRGNLSANLGFTSDRLATVSNNGTMEYRLQFSNLSDSSKGEGGTYMTGAILLDVFPFVGDETAAHADRNSQWSMQFDPTKPFSVTIESIQSEEDMDETVVEKTLTPGTDYKVYYFNRPIDETNLQTVYGQIESLTYDAANLPAGWSDRASDDTRAFAVAVNDTQESIALAPNQSYVVHYQLNVGDLDEETLAQYAWNNAVNHFLCSYSSYTKSAGIATARRSPQSLNSNLVSNTILPTQVKVGGHVWVDKNADGIRQAGELATEMPDNALVRQLLEDVQVTLETYEGDGTIPTVTNFAKTGEDWDNNANFIFDKLDPASPKENASQSQLYGNNVLNNPLNPFYLKGQAPKTYRITASLPEGSVLATLTGLGGGNPDKEEQGYSRDPELLASQYADETVDNNFLAQAKDTTAYSERFFLYSKPEEIFDNTKDVGYLLQRTLTLTKTNKDGTQNLPGATFQVYGPFNSVEEANAATLSQANLVEEVTTDATGSATLTTPLNWFQVYLIVEKDSPFGYQLEGATAANGDGVVRDYTGTATRNPAWILDVPGNAVTNQNQQVTVADRTEVEYNLTATKTLEGKPLQDNQFTFELLDVNMQSLATARNIGGVATFPTLSADRSGETTYYIREVIPQDAQQLVYDNTLYDDAMYKVVVQVITNPDNGRLEETIRYYGKNADGTWTETSQGARFTNRYLPAFETAYSPAVLKQFSSDSDPRSADDTFTFVLAAAQDYGAAVRMTPGSDGRCTATVVDEGVARFQPVTFTQEGVYRFTLGEDNDGLEGYTYDGTRWILEVEVTRQENDLVVTRADYTTEDGKKAGLATFTNSYHGTGTPPETPPESPSDEEKGTTPTAPTTPLQALQQLIRTLLPQTGDESHPLVWVILLCVSAVCLAGIYFYRKRKR